MKIPVLGSLLKKVTKMLRVNTKVMWVYKEDAVDWKIAYENLIVYVIALILRLW